MEKLWVFDGMGCQECYIIAGEIQHDSGWTRIRLFDMVFSIILERRLVLSTVLVVMSEALIGCVWRYAVISRFQGLPLLAYGSDVK